MSDLTKPIEQKSIPIKEIDTGLRARKTYEKIEELSHSITEHGLIQPIALLDKSKVDDWTGIEKEDLDPDRPYLLLAGGRRFTAWRYGDHGHSIPARIYDKAITADEMKSIELYENLHRIDLSWQEQVDLLDEIHELQTKIHGKPIRGVSDQDAHTIEDTGKMLGKSKSSISQDLKLANAMKKLPQLREAKTKADARKMLKKLSTDVKADKKAKEILERKANSHEDERKKKLANSYVLGDVFEMIKEVPDQSIDLVEIDPPYAIDLHDVKKGHSTNTDDYTDVFVDEYEDFLNNLLSECYRTMKRNSWLVFWFAPEPWFETVYQALQNAGFETRRIPAIWNKRNGQTMQPAMYLGNAHEMFFYARKGKPSIKKQGRSNVYDFSPVNSSTKVHPTERPIELMEEVIKTFAEPDSKCLVPFAGSGNTLLACNNLDIKSIGYDISEKYQNDFVIRVHEGELNNYKSYGRKEE